MFFQVWRAGVKPHLLNISLRLIIIGGGCSAAAGRRRRWPSAILLTSRRLLRRRLASPVGPESRGKHPVSQIALDVVRCKPHTNGPHAPCVSGGASPRIQTLLTRRWASERNESNVVPDSGTRHWARALLFLPSLLLPLTLSEETRAKKRA